MAVALPRLGRRKRDADADAALALGVPLTVIHMLTGSSIPPAKSAQETRGGLSPIKWGVSCHRPRVPRRDLQWGTGPARDGQPGFASGGLTRWLPAAGVAATRSRLGALVALGVILSRPSSGRARRSEGGGGAGNQECCRAVVTGRAPSCSFYSSAACPGPPVAVSPPPAPRARARDGHGRGRAVSPGRLFTSDAASIVAGREQVGREQRCGAARRGRPGVSIYVVAEHLQGTASTPSTRREGDTVLRTCLQANACPAIQWRRRRSRTAEPPYISPVAVAPQIPHYVHGTQGFRGRVFLPRTIAVAVPMYGAWSWDRAWPATVHVVGHDSTPTTDVLQIRQSGHASRASGLSGPTVNIDRPK